MQLYARGGVIFRHPSRIMGEKMTKKLYEMNEGELSVITGLNDCGRGIAERLRGLGFESGATVMCTMKSPLCDPAAYLIKGSVFALRRVDADVISVEDCTFGGESEACDA